MGGQYLGHFHFILTVVHSFPERYRAADIETGPGRQHYAHKISLTLQLAAVGQLEEELEKFVGDVLGDQGCDVSGQERPHNPDEDNWENVHKAAVAYLLGGMLEDRLVDMFELISDLYLAHCIPKICITQIRP